MQTMGLTKEVTIIGKKRINALAKFDTGAMSSSIDVSLAKKAGLGPILGYKRIKSSSSSGHRRPLVNAKIKIGSKTFEQEANLADRSHSRCAVLIGRDIILNNFVIDLSKTHNGPRERDVRT